MDKTVTGVGLHLYFSRASKLKNDKVANIRPHSVGYILKQDVIVQIIEVQHYATLCEFLDVEGWKNAAPHLGSFDETEKDYLQFYPGDFIKKAGGMNGIIVAITPPML